MTTIANASMHGAVNGVCSDNDRSVIEISQCESHVSNHNARQQMERLYELRHEIKSSRY